MSDVLNLKQLLEDAETAYLKPCEHRESKACWGCYVDRIVDYDDHVVALINRINTLEAEHAELKDSWVWKAYDVGALPEEVLAKKRALTEALAEVVLLRGAIAAQDEREKAAGILCGVPYEQHGCDWPDWVAEELNYQRSQAEHWQRMFKSDDR